MLAGDQSRVRELKHKFYPIRDDEETNFCHYFRRYQSEFPTAQ